MMHILLLSLTTLITLPFLAVSIPTNFTTTVITTTAQPCPTSTATTTLQFCGGFANLPCPGDLVCVEDPRDDCDPENGGADCGGVRAVKDQDFRTEVRPS